MIDRFRELFGSDGSVRVFRAPGRVNLIGEHTDYNLGFVLPVALELATYVAASPAPDPKLRVYSEAEGELAEFEIDEIGSLKPQRRWTDYLIGVARQLLRAGIAILPANMLVRSAVPVGSGLSSSAALEVSSALAFLNGRDLPSLELAKLCQRAEVEFVGMPCGIMDQHVSIFGRAHCAVEIDCRSLEHRLVHLPDRAAFYAVNTMVKHELAASAYRERVAECAAAVELIKKRFPAVRSLRDVSPEQFGQVERFLPPLIARRARHVVTENARVEAFVAASEDSDLRRMGALMVESHRSLQHDYAVSSPELDFLVDTALSFQGVYGSRMTGGGFGGCTVTMIDPDTAATFCDRIAASYHEQFAITPQIYECRPSEGAAEWNNLETIPALTGLK
jgi:galactokinase